MSRYLSFFLMLFLLHQCSLPSSEVSFTNDNHKIVHSREADFQLELIAQGMNTPWSMDWLPDGKALISDRKGSQIFLFTPGDTTLTPIRNTPKAFTFLDSGMREVLVPADYKKDGWIYISYDSSRVDSSSTLIVERAKFDGYRLFQREILFEAQPWYPSGYHYGGRLVIQDDYLFISVGDRHFRDSAQVLHKHNGKIIRIYKDGSVPEDNPFVGHPTAQPEIWSYGHRNPQGMVLHPETGQLWEHEHGPKGGDEINLIKRGRNYGWPLITHGEEYEGGAVGEGRMFQEDMEAPWRHYSPSVAPSGMTFYSGRSFPEWHGNLFFGAMSQRNLYRLGISGGRIRAEERLLENKGWRIRFICQGPDGLLYFGTDEGKVWRIRPVRLVEKNLSAN